MRQWSRIVNVHGPLRKFEELSVCVNDARRVCSQPQSGGCQHDAKSRDVNLMSRNRQIIISDCLSTNAQASGMQGVLSSSVPEVIARMRFLELLHEIANDGVHVLLHRTLHPSASRRRSGITSRQRDGVVGVTGRHAPIVLRRRPSDRIRTQVNEAKLSGEAAATVIFVYK